MKDIIKNNLKLIFAVVITGIIACSASVYAAASILSKDVSYTKKDGTEINVKTALDELYSTRQVESYDMLDKSTITGSGYNFKKVSLKKDTQEKMLYIKVEADVVQQDINDLLTIDISDLDINSIVDWKVCNFTSSGDFRVSTSEFTKDSIGIRCDSNWGYATKYNYDYVIVIKYN
ncbi:MAG: hypothetical protein J6M60_05920 [Clostridia bacterium]|nr:hypothetical protein [Clostridia bacterium]